MKKEGIAVTQTKSSGLPCDNVIHIDMSGVTSNPPGIAGAISSAFSYKIKDRIKQALEKAEEIKAATVAFPALGKLILESTYNRLGQLSCFMYSFTFVFWGLLQVLLWYGHWFIVEGHNGT